MKKQQFIVTITVFVLLSVLFFMLNSYVPEYSFGTLEAGNIIMAGLSIINFIMIGKQMDTRPQAFVRAVSGASFLKLMVCMISVLVYVLLNRTHIHKPSVFVLFGIYIIYTTIETWLLTKFVRK